MMDSVCCLIIVVVGGRLFADIFFVVAWCYEKIDAECCVDYTVVS